MVETLANQEPQCSIQIDGNVFDFPTVTGAEGEKAIDILKLRDRTGYITLDTGYGNTGSCQSAITFIDGEKGILRYRGYPIEELAVHATFIEAAYLVIYGELPTPAQLNHFSGLLTESEMLHEGMKYHFEGFPTLAPPMAILSSMVNALGCFHPQLLQLGSDENFDIAVARLLSKVRTIAAFSYKMSIDEPFVYPKPELSYCANLLHMMYSIPYKEFQPDPDVVAALNLILVLHADHEQNCSTSTVRMVGSSGANLFASIAAGVCALWGPLHGGANMAVIEMLQEIHDNKMTPAEYIAKVKDASSSIRLMGFGHRVYKNFDPRSKIIKMSCDKVLAKLGVSDPLLEIAKELEAAALRDDYFISRSLYPNVDFYSGIIMRAIGLPLNMFTVMFAIGRMPGWIANWREVHNDAKGRIYRPRQVYVGPTVRHYVPLEKR